MPNSVHEEKHSAQLIKKCSIESTDECNLRMNKDDCEQNHHKEVLQTFRENNCSVSRKIFNSSQKLDLKLKSE